MSLRGAAAVVGLAERAPRRYTGDETNLDLLSGVATEALADAGIDRADVDGLLVHPIGGLPGFVPATVAEFVPPGRRGRFYGFFYTTNEIGTVIAPLAYGFVADLFSLRTTMLAMGAATAAILPASLTLRRHLERAGF